MKKKFFNTPLIQGIIAAFAFAATIFPLFIFPSSSDAEVMDRIAAIINDSIITLSELDAATAAALDKLSPEEKKDGKLAVEVRSRTLDSIIEQKLVKQASDRAGIEISEREVDNAVEDVKKRNRLSHEEFLIALAQSGLTYREYREQVKEQIRQVKFVNKEFRSKVSVEDEDIANYYKQHIEEFKAREEMRLRVIFVSSVDKKLMDRKLRIIENGLGKGADFTALAKEYSDGAQAAQGGDLGHVRPGEINKALEEAAATLVAGAVSKALTTEEGVYFIQLVEKRPGEPKSLEDARNAINEKLFSKLMEERFKFWLKEVKKNAHIEVRL
ncbi:MAG: SurA N-terminal domain-containing protein [Deltaproteobacteria bacterium]|nr:SurA N-terminal domain-containing protein [Deltaproteobacteria bacterium]